VAWRHRFLPARERGGHVRGAAASWEGQLLGRRACRLRDRRVSRSVSPPAHSCGEPCVLRSVSGIERDVADGIPAPDAACLAFRPAPARSLVDLAPALEDHRLPTGVAILRCDESERAVEVPGVVPADEGRDPRPRVLDRPQGLEGDSGRDWSVPTRGRGARPRGRPRRRNPGSRVAPRGGALVPSPQELADFSWSTSSAAASASAWSLRRSSLSSPWIRRTSDERALDFVCPFTAAAIRARHSSRCAWWIPFRRRNAPSSSPERRDASRTAARTSSSVQSCGRRAGVSSGSRASTSVTPPASRSQRERVGWAIPVSRARAVALFARGPVIFRTRLDRAVAVHSMPALAAPGVVGGVALARRPHPPPWVREGGHRLPHRGDNDPDTEGDGTVSLLGMDEPAGPSGQTRSSWCWNPSCPHRSQPPPLPVRLGQDWHPDGESGRRGPVSRLRRPTELLSPLSGSLQPEAGAAGSLTGRGPGGARKAWSGFAVPSHHSGPVRAGYTRAPSTRVQGRGTQKPGGIPSWDPSSGCPGSTRRGESL
jgi:hypothetical protein